MTQHVASQLQLIDLMVSHEEGLQELYELFAERFTWVRHFWYNIAREEHGHAQLLRQLRDEVAAGAVAIADERFSPHALRGLLEYMKSQLTLVRHHDELTLSTALSIALDLEEQLIEQAVFQHFASDDPKLQQKFILLNAEVQEHLARLQQMKQESTARTK